VSQSAGQVTSPSLTPSRLAASGLPAFIRTFSSLVALATLVIFNILFTPNFLAVGTFNANMTQVATIVIVAVGMTFVIATGGIDLSDR
jgi:ribose/xylose/arabinose/galactoside ABC-type transport system permease subunit